MSEKKLSVFIADDEPRALEQLRLMVNAWAAFNNVVVDFTLLKALDTDSFSTAAGCDLVLLDIEMGADNGLDFAKRVRALSDTATIAFITGHSEFAIEGYDAQASAFLIKPVSQEKLSSLLALALKKVGDMTAKRLVLQRNKTYHYFDLSEIVYIEASGHSSIIATAKGKQTFPVSLGELEAKIPAPPFIICHRGFFANVNHIKCYENKSSLRMDSGELVPIGKLYAANIKAELFVAIREDEP